MPDSPPNQASMTWLLFAILAFSSWGTYGVCIHSGVTAMNPTGADPNARYKAYLFVGVAYFFAAVLAPILVMLLNGSSWNFPTRGMWLSLLAGCVGALGAFFVLLAMGSVGRRTWMIPVIMAVVFAGAPIVNALVALALHPPAGGWTSIRPQFWIGIVVAALGATMVTYYKPGPSPRKQESPTETTAAATESPSAEPEETYGRAGS